MSKCFKTVVSMILLVLLLGVSIGGVADFGDFSGDQDYGYDDAFDASSNDNSNDNDNDSRVTVIGGSTGSGSSGSSGGGSGGSGGSSGSGGNMLVTVIVIGAIVVIGLSRKGKSGGTGTRTKQPPLKETGVKATPVEELQPLDTLRAQDPNFSEAELKQRISNLYVQMQNGWSAKDITPLRGDFTDAQFAQYDRQLQRYRDEGQTSKVERISVLDVSFAGVKQDEKHDILVVNLSTRVTTYTVDDKTGDVVRGSRNEEKFMRYEWTMIRTKGAQTPGEDGVGTTNCPNCGAALNVNQSAQCPYCNSVISKSDYDWVISGIKGLSQRTR